MADLYHSAVSADGMGCVNSPQSCPQEGIVDSSIIQSCICIDVLLNACTRKTHANVALHRPCTTAKCKETGVKNVIVHGSSLNVCSTQIYSKT